MDPFELESFLIPSDEWYDKDIPDELLKKAEELSNTGVPTAIGWHPDIGWFGHATGQGPFVWWSEKEENKE